MNARELADTRYPGRDHSSGIEMKRIKSPTFSDCGFGIMRGPDDSLSGSPSDKRSHQNCRCCSWGAVFEQPLAALQPGQRVVLAIRRSGHRVELVARASLPSPRRIRRIFPMRARLASVQNQELDKAACAAQESYSAARRPFD